MSFILFWISSAFSCTVGENGCAQCDLVDNCIECATGYVLDEYYNCLCDKANHYYLYEGSCQQATPCDAATSGVDHCNYCIQGNCMACEQNLILYENTCGCPSALHWVEDETSGCKCAPRYGLSKDGTCKEIVNFISRGCEQSLGYYGECIKCIENFELKDSKCVCKPNYVLDEFANEGSKSRCVELFPTSCPEGCNCDDSNQKTCISCKENYTPEYHQDLITLRQCIPKTRSQCKEGLYYNPFMSKCVERILFTNEYYNLGCIYGSENECQICEDGYDKYFDPTTRLGYCSLKSAVATKSLYADLSDQSIVGENVISVDGNQIEFNLQKILPEKRRPYTYKMDDESIQTVQINNEPSIDFQIELAFSTLDSAITISPLTGSTNLNPEVTITSYWSVNLELQTKMASLYGIEKCTLSSSNDEIELNKVTLSNRPIEFIIDKNLKINEFNSFQPYCKLSVTSKSRTATNLKVSISTLYIHQRSKLPINCETEVGTVKMETGSQIETMTNSFSCQHIQVKMSAASVSNAISYLINGSIKGVPQSITLNLSPKDTLLYENVKDLPSIGLVYGNNEEFINNCQQWADVYNKNPTDTIYNVAKCTISQTSASLEINSDGSGVKSGGGGGGDSNAGMIAGIVVGVIVVIAVVIVLLYFFVIKPRQANKNNSSANEDNNKENEAEVA